jgi:hypothetical protein
MDDTHPMPLTQAIIPMGYRGHIAQASDHGVAEWAGDELTARLDQRHLDGGVSAPDVLRAGRTTETTANDHDPTGGLRPGPPSQSSDQEKRTGAAQKLSSRWRNHRRAPWLTGLKLS